MIVPHTDPASKPKPYKRIIFYHQTHYKDDKYISLQPSILPATGVTHVIIAAIHLNTPERITLNDDLYDADKFIPLWDEVRQLQEAGVKVLGMLGGAAQGSYTKMDGSLEGFRRWYQPLRKMIAWARFDGLDLDIEEAMSLGGVVRLIDHLKTDFGQSFLITLAPVAPALLNRQNLGGFNMEELEKGLGSRIACKTRDYDTIIARGWPQEKVVIGLVTSPANCSGHVKEAKLRACLKELVSRYPRIGGIMGWEYYNSVTEASPQIGEPWKWAEMINDMLNGAYIEEEMVLASDRIEGEAKKYEGHDGDLS
ncbi:chitinase [Fusarium oxysporum]|nr:chitinase [Fusarium oxysporum]